MTAADRPPARRRAAAVTAATALALSTAAVGAPAGAEGDPVPPVAGRTVADFDPPDPDWMPGHRGIDLAGEPGEPVSTPRAGVVAFVGLVGSVPVVVVRHGIARATYQPVSSNLAPGDLVAAGDPLGALAPEGGHCGGSCLHWGLIVSGAYIDPRLMLGRVRVSLVPQ